MTRQRKNHRLGCKARAAIATIKSDNTVFEIASTHGSLPNQGMIRKMKKSIEE